MKNSYLLFFILLLGCNDTIQPEYIQPTEGSLTEGGIVFYLFEPGDDNYVDGEVHGLVCDISNTSTASVWGCEGFHYRVSGWTIGSGDQNSLEIVAQCAQDNIAAKICLDANINGYDDWFLPSLPTLLKMREVQQLIDSVAIANGGDKFNSKDYWSSNGCDDIYAHKVYFSPEGGGDICYGKGSSGYIRAVRKF